MLLAIVLGLLSGGVNSGLLAVVNKVIGSQGNSSTEAVLIFAGLCLTAALLRVASESILASLGQQSIFVLRTELSSQVLAAPLRQLEEIGPHQILSVLTDDIPSIAGVIAAIPQICINGGVVAGCIGFMGWLQWKLMLTVLCLMGIGVSTYQFGVAYASRQFQRARRRDTDLQRHFRGLIYGIKELKLHAGRSAAFHHEAIRRTADDVRNANTKGLFTFVVASSWGQLLVFFAIGLITFFLARALNVGAGIITGFSLALLYVTTPLQTIMNSVPALARADVAIANAQKLGFKLMKPETPQIAPTASETVANSVRLDLSRVTYAYDGDGDSDRAFQLGPIDLTIRPGELLFIVGGNGSGKTTLAKVLLGLYTPDRGEIRFNGQLVTNKNRQVYRQLFSAIFSDFFLFDSFFGLDKAHVDRRASEYLVSLRLAKKVSIQNGTLSTTELSQGQRKRLALLTAYLEDRPIYFFDEWAADQEPAFKEVFYFDILPALKSRGKAVIVISHDDRYYSVADRVIKLESGHMSAADVSLTASLHGR